MLAEQRHPPSRATVLEIPRAEIRVPDEHVINSASLDLLDRGAAQSRPRRALGFLGSAGELLPLAGFVHPVELQSDLVLIMRALERHGIGFLRGSELH